MNYAQAVQHIHSLLSFGINPGLERIAQLLEQLGSPQEHMKFVHVAGTNGKGSVSAMIDASLRAAGHRTGLFTSPYVTDFCERIQLDGKNIPHDELASVTAKIKLTIETMPAGYYVTEFEMITAVALEWFRQQNCEIAVMETGLGGRLDSTNVIPAPLVCVLTRIAIDHADILGNTLEAITKEKCGIIKPGVPVVMYPEQDESVCQVIKEYAARNNCKLLDCMPVGATCDSPSLCGNSFIYQGRQWKTRMCGEHQILNAATAITALREIGVPDGAIDEGLSKAFLPARQEVIRRNPTVILDGGHNPDGAAALAAMISRQKKNFGAVYGIIGCLRDKDYESIFTELCPLFTEVYTVPIQNPRTLTAEEAAKTALLYCQKVHITSSPEEAFSKIWARINPDNLIVICGSLYLAGQIRPTLLEYSY